MKLLLDENLPKRLKIDLASYHTFTVRDLGWNGKKNGELLSLMLEQGFTALLTFDKNIRNQQNFRKYPLVVIVLVANNNTYRELQKLCSKIIETLQKDNLSPGVYIIST